MNADLILNAMQTKAIVMQWEAAEDLMANWSGLLERTKRVQVLLSKTNG
ncbi:MAG: hypothetical protein ACI9LY_001864 [Arenicella sp.]|jgi:hypothetical protein